MGMSYFQEVNDLVVLHERRWRELVAGGAFDALLVLCSESINEIHSYDFIQNDIGS